MAIDSFTKTILKESLSSLLFLGSIYIIYGLLSVQNLFTMGLTILGISLFKDSLPTLIKNIKKYVKSIIILTILFSIINYSVKYGLIGFIVITLAIAGWRLWSGRDTYMKGIRNIEKRIFGRPLDRDYVEEEEDEKNDTK